MALVIPYYINGQDKSTKKSIDIKIKKKQPKRKQFKKNKLQY